MKLIKAMATVGGLTGVSRVAGFVRDILTASMIGAGPIADAFFVALKLPNLFRRVTAEGAFSVSFVPLYSETLEKEGEEKAADLANNAFSVMFWSLLAFTIICVILMPYIICLIAPGFFGDVTRYANAVEMSRVTFPYLLMMSIAALMGGILNAHSRFAPFAAAPILFNLSMVLFLLAHGLFKTPGHAMSWGIFAAGIFQCGMLWYFLKKAGMRLSFVRPRFKEQKIAKLFKLMGPGVLGAGVMHINLFADIMMASFLPTGAISFLYYADRLNQLPLGMVGIAVGTALLPMLSRAIASGNGKEAQHLFNRALEVCMLLALPAAVGLLMAAYPIIMTLFHHGEFSYHSADMTSKVLISYAFGMPAYIVVKILSTSFWARQDTVTPVRAAIFSTVFNIVAGLFFIIVLKIGVMGIALATSIAGWLQMGLLIKGLRRSPETQLDARCTRALVKIAVCCAAMAGYVFVAKGFLMPYYEDGDDMLMQIGGLAAIIGGGMAVYGGGVMALGVVRISDFKKMITRPAKAAGADTPKVDSGGELS